MSEWQRVCDKLPSEEEEVLVAYKEGLVYQGYWRKLNAILGEQEIEWRVYSISGITEYPEPDYWMEIPPLPLVNAIAEVSAKQNEI